MFVHFPLAPLYPDPPDRRYDEPGTGGRVHVTEGVA